ncbi:Lsm6 Lsm protein [Pseudovirgaria hyperparasitica]|uniref:U6 snRNA-associated Sm-like protein LSm6 n=1 Tax=Pseudovirgaria hyperparasitica TaxID=470096 RepID=A0A6A6W2A0_9PEZI|nr:Lsm6 Lsm protein [Pseudovirgaria hyperparasitica]KAF2757048.1 Lsm6 Lsm protein [Pseudovirgaria hyperparasitica]
MENGADPQTDPSTFLSSMLGAPVTVKLNSGIVYKVWNIGSYQTGDLQSVDGYMNIALEQCKEIVDGKPRRNYGDAFLRGNNGGQP